MRPHEDGTPANMKRPIGERQMRKQRREERSRKASEGSGSGSKRPNEQQPQTHVKWRRAARREEVRHKPQRQKRVKTIQILRW